MKIYFFLIHIFLLSNQSFADVMTDTRNEESALAGQESGLSDNFDNLGIEQQNIKTQIKAVEADQVNIQGEIDVLLSQIQALKNSGSMFNASQINDLNNQLKAKYAQLSQANATKSRLNQEMSILNSSLNNLILHYCSFESIERSKLFSIRIMVSTHESNLEDYSLAELSVHSSNMNSLKQAFLSKYQETIDTGLPSNPMSCTDRVRHEYLDQPAYATSVESTLEFDVINTFNGLVELVDKLEKKRNEQIAILMIIID